MPLQLPVLQSQILSVLRTQTADVASQATRLANAYNAYALTALAGVAAPIFTGTESARLASILLPSILTPGPAQRFAQAFADGLLSFWTVPPVVFTDGVNAGVPLFTTGPILTASLTVALAAPQDATLAAQSIAAALDTATRSITVLLQPSNLVFPLL